LPAAVEGREVTAARALGHNTREKPVIIGTTVKVHAGTSQKITVSLNGCRPWLFRESPRCAVPARPSRCLETAFARGDAG
jgi:hypothetical protein